jgi:hypothetical protein
MTTESALAVRMRQEITLGSVELVVGSQLLRRKPETLLKEIREHLPSIVEARLYLAIGPTLRHKPKTFALIVREFMGTQEIQATDFETAPGATEPKIVEFLGDLQVALGLILRMPNDYSNLRIGAVSVARLVLAFGVNAEMFISSIMDNIPEVGRALGYSGRGSSRNWYGEDGEDYFPEGKIAKHAFGFWSHVIYPYCIAKGIPPMIEFLEIFEDEELLRGAIAASGDEWLDEGGPKV